MDPWLQLGTAWPFLSKTGSSCSKIFGMPNCCCWVLLFLLSFFFLSNFFGSFPVKPTPGLDVRFQTSVNVFPMVFQLPPLFVEPKTPSPTFFPPLLNFITGTRWAASLRTDFPLRINEGLAATPYFTLRIQKKCGWLTREKTIKNWNYTRVVKESHEGMLQISSLQKNVGWSKTNKEREAEFECFCGLWGNLLT